MNVVEKFSPQSIGAGTHLSNHGVDDRQFGRAKFIVGGETHPTVAKIDSLACPRTHEVRQCGVNQPVKCKHTRGTLDKIGISGSFRIHRRCALALSHTSLPNLSAATCQSVLNQKDSRVGMLMRRIKEGLYFSSVDKADGGSLGVDSRLSDSVEIRDAAVRVRFHRPQAAR
jgi:hypothetical protein